MLPREVSPQAVEAASAALRRAGLPSTYEIASVALAGALTPLHRAITVEGRSPGLHRRAVRWVRHEWPSLWAALDGLGVTRGDAAELR